MWKPIPTTAVSVKTEAELNRLIAYFKSVNLRLVHTSLVERWKRYQDEMCVNVSYSDTVNSETATFYKEACYKVITTDEYFALIGQGQTELCPDCKGTKQYISLLFVNKCPTCCKE